MSNADVITDWVKAGGVLVMLGNDAGNADLKSLNNLASRFGIRFNEDNFNLVINNQFEQGSILIPSNHSIFKSAKKIYIKELAAIDLNKPATTVLIKMEKI